MSARISNASTTYTWRDSELTAPPLRALNAVGSGLTRLGIERPSLTSDAVMAGAAKAVGSHDFGSDSFREPLDIFLESCREEAELTTFGRILVTKMLQSALANRIELHRWSSTHPEAAEERITDPWVIVGLPRTGTSLLSNLLGLDPMNRNLLQWEAAHLIPPATIEEAASDPRIARTTKELDGLMKLNPPLRVMHPFGATLAQECVSLFMYDARTLAGTRVRSRPSRHSFTGSTSPRPGSHPTSSPFTAGCPPRCSPRPCKVPVRTRAGGRCSPNSARSPRSTGTTSSGRTTRPTRPSGPVTSSEMSSTAPSSGSTIRR